MTSEPSSATNTRFPYTPSGPTSVGYASGEAATNAEAGAAIRHGLVELGQDSPLAAELDSGGVLRLDDDATPTRKAEHEIAHLGNGAREPGRFRRLDRAPPEPGGLRPKELFDPVLEIEALGRASRGFCRSGSVANNRVSQLGETLFDGRLELGEPGVVAGRVERLVETPLEQTSRPEQGLQLVDEAPGVSVAVAGVQTSQEVRHARL